MNIRLSKYCGKFNFPFNAIELKQITWAAKGVNKLQRWVVKVSQLWSAINIELTLIQKYKLTEEETN